MIIKRTIIAKKDESTGLFVKFVETSNGIYMGRKIAINNTYYNCEKSRILYQKPLLDSPLQTMHIHHDKYKNKWRMEENGEFLEDAEAHADSTGRLFIPYLQMTQKLWDTLDWKGAESMFQKIARRGFGIVPYPIPLDATLDEWLVRKKDALQTLNKSQELLPVLCIFHDVEKFYQIVKSEFMEEKLLGLHYYDIKSPITQANLNALYEISYNTAEGIAVPLVIGFCPRKRIEYLSSVSSVYALSIYGIDIVSHYVMKPEQMTYVEESGPEKYPFYDAKEGGYTDSETQVAWYGKELTRTQLSNISVEEGLSPFQANLWADYLKETEDLDGLNQSIFKENSLEYIHSKSRWHTAIMTVFPNRRF